VPVVAGVGLIVSAFLPWVYVGNVALRGFPDTGGLWVVAFGLIAITLASLSIYTRRNSRHPLLVVGLVTLGIFILAYNWMERTVRERAWARTQAVAIVDGVAPPPPPVTSVGSGIYAGFAASTVLVLFGLTIVVKRVQSPYAPPDEDD
jgi:apolipoprotein N-acyltransferase